MAVAAVLAEHSGRAPHSCEGVVRGRDLEPRRAKWASVEDASVFGDGEEVGQLAYGVAARDGKRGRQRLAHRLQA